MRALVRGGTCYIDFYVRSKLIWNNLLVSNLETIYPRAQFYKGSICNSRILTQIFTKLKNDVLRYFSTKLIMSLLVPKLIEYLENNGHNITTWFKVMKKYKINNLVSSLIIKVEILTYLIFITIKKMFD